MASKEDLKLEREYQAALKISASGVSALQANIKKLLDDKRALKKETKDYIKGLSDASKQLSGSESIGKQIVKNQNEINQLKKGEHKLQQGSNKFTKAGTAAAIKALEQQNMSLAVYGKQQEAIERVKEKAENLNSKYGEGVDKLAGYTSQIPIVGNLFGGMAKKAANSLKGTFGNATKKYIGAYGKSMQNGARLTQKLGKNIGGAAVHLKSLGAGAAAAGGSMLKAFMGPQAILLLIIGALAAGFYAIKQFEAGMKSFRGETGLVKGQMGDIEKTAASIGQATMNLTGDVAEGAKVVGQMVAGFGSIERLSDATLANATKLSLSYGIGADNIAQTNKMFQNLNGLTEEQAQFMTTNVAKFAELNDVSPDAVMKDINESSADMYKYFRGSPNELMKAAVQARKLGTSLKQSAEVSKSLLNFEDSINSELEASAILGRNLNFNEARFKAAKGDTLGAQQAIMKEVSKLGDLTKLNVYQQEALAKATGMPIEDLINQQRIKQKLGKLSDEDAAAAQQLLKSGKDITKMTKEKAKAALENQKIENKNVERTKEMENQMKQMMLQLASAFAPLAESLIKFLQDNMPQIKSFITGTATLIGGVVDGIQSGLAVVKTSLQPVFDIFSDLFGGDEAKGFSDTLTTIGKIIGGTLTYSINFMAKTFTSVVDIAMGLWNVIKGIFTLDFSLIGEGLKQAFGGFVDWFVRIPETIIDLLASVFSDVNLFQEWKEDWDNTITWIKEIPSMVWGFFTGLKDKIKGVFSNMLPDWLAKKLGLKTDVALTDGGSVNDGIIQNGKIIGTNPEDSIIAMKKPEDLASNMAGKMSGFFGGLTETIGASLSGVGNLFGGITNKIGSAIMGVGGENSDSNLTTMMTTLMDVLTTGFRGISSIVSGSVGEGGMGGLDAESVQGTILKMSSDTIEAKLDTINQYATESTTMLSEAMSTLNKTLETTSTENTKKMIEKLEEVRKAVIVGALIEMDGDILTRNLAGKQEAFNRVNFASRLKS